MVLELYAKMLDGSVSPNGAVVVLSVEFGTCDSSFLDNLDDDSIEPDVSRLAIELDLVMILEVRVLEVGNRSKRRSKGQDPLVAHGRSWDVDFQ